MANKYSDLICQWLVELGFKKCFYVAGGNMMHLLESASKYFDCIPFVHEVSAGIAADYHNESIPENGDKAFVLVTAGPGLTNLVTAICGSFLESRELIVVGGQVKSSDLKMFNMRQNGIQEVDGVSLVSSITKQALRLINPLPKETLISFFEKAKEPRKGPIFLEVCLDVQAMEYSSPEIKTLSSKFESPDESRIEIADNIEKIKELLSNSKRPLFLIGGEISRKESRTIFSNLDKFGIPVMTTWNAADRLDSNKKYYFGRPDTWGMRYSNILIQQSDCLIVFGARLSLQQTGFNYSQFVPNGKIIHIYSDSSEFKNRLTNVYLEIVGNSDLYLQEIIATQFNENKDWESWMNYCGKVKKLLPLSESSNNSYSGFWNPYEFYLELSNQISNEEALIPSSSGGAETVAMQTFLQKQGVTIITSSALASMGYGLAGAIGVAISRKKVYLVEGDGGFAQNLQELGTAERQKLNLKIFILSNEGYASIRMTQKNYFNENYIGCDRETGLGLPDWGKLFDAYGIKWLTLEPGQMNNKSVQKLLDEDGLVAFIVPVHPNQSYFPKINSRVLKNGQMQSDPLHEMSPRLETDVRNQVLRYISVSDEGETSI